MTKIKNIIGHKVNIDHAKISLSYGILSLKDNITLETIIRCDETYTPKTISHAKKILAERKKENTHDLIFA